MTRDRIGTQELDSVLAMLDQAQQQAEVSAAAEGPPPRPLRAATATQNTLFDAVRVEGEDQLGRAVGEEKLAILRKKVRALEDRVQDIRDAWSARDAELDEARQETAREKRRAERAEENVKKLTSILQTMKNEVTAYHGRVQEALHEAARREHDLELDSDRRLREAQQRADRRVHEAEQEGARREQQLLREHSERERTALQEHSRREQEAVRDHQRREQTLTERLERAEQAARQAVAAREREQAMPPPPPLITKGDLEELAQSVDTAGRTISGILKGRVRESELAATLRETMNLLRSNHELLTSVLRDIA